MKYKSSLSRKIFLVFNYTFITLLTFLCVFPLIHVFSISLSSSIAASSGVVKLLPVDFTLQSYEYVFNKVEFWRAFFISVQRVAIGVPIQMLIICLVAYPLSRKDNAFRGRKIFSWFFLISILFSGGLIPTYLIVYKTGLINTIWSLVIPSAVPVFSIIVLLNFFKQLPQEIEESAFIDGAGHYLILFKIYIPLSTPSLVTLLLFSFVGHWNSWFDGIIFMNNPKNYPLQSYLNLVVTQIQSSVFSNNIDSIKEFSQVSDRTFRAAQIFLGAIPILVIYPLLQRHFMSGIVLGSVKG
jgi:putative aldouronate transport system permease protein